MLAIEVTLEMMPWIDIETDCLTSCKYSIVFGFDVSYDVFRPIKQNVP